MNQVFLKVNEGIAVLTEKVGNRPHVCIGRNRDMDIPIIEDDAVSRKHAAIVNVGFLGIIDLKSTNGTYVNGKKIEKGAVLEFGDVITLGKTDLVLLGFSYSESTQKGGDHDIG